MKIILNDIDGKKVTIDGGKVPELYVAYIAAIRADYYAELDSGRGYGEYDKIFQEEFNIGLRHLDMIEDWRENNTDLPVKISEDILVIPK